MPHGITPLLSGQPAIAQSAAKNSTAQKEIPEEVMAAAQDFEAMFLSEMLSHMFAGIEVNETFGGGQGEEIFKGFLIREYGRITAQAGGIGIADSVAQEILKIQELYHDPSTAPQQ